MNVTLKQSENKVELYVDKKLATIFENKSTKQVSDWIERNLKGVKIHMVFKKM